MDLDNQKRQLKVVIHQLDCIPDQQRHLQHKPSVGTPEFSNIFEFDIQENEKEQLTSELCNDEGVIFSDTAAPTVRDVKPNYRNPYKKVPGTADDSGHLFEVKMVLLTFLRCLTSGRDFRLASNVFGAGKFDDIVIEQECEPHTILVQLKHKTKPIRISKFLGFDGKMSILMYFKSYRDDIYKNFGDDCQLVFYTNVKIPKHFFNPITHENFLSSSEHGFSRFFSEQDEDVYELPSNIAKYEMFLKEIKKATNEITDEDISEYIRKRIKEFIPLKSKVPFSHKLLTLHKSPTRNNIEKFIIEVEKLGDLSLYHNFLSKFKLYYCQANERELNEVIKSELRRETGVNNTEELPKLLERVRLWWKNKEAYYLSGNDDIWNAYIRDIFLSIDENKWSEEKRNKIQMNEGIVSQLRDQISSAQVLHIFVDGDCTALASCKVRQALESTTGAPPIITSVKVALLDSDSVLGAWKSRWGRVLVLEADKEGLDAEEMFSTLSDILRDHQEKTLIVITNINDLQTTNQVRTLRGERYVEWRDVTCLTDMTVDTQKYLLATEVTFQGHKVLLDNLVNFNKDLKNAVNETLLMALIREENITIGEELQDPIDFYIPRILKRQGVSFFAESPTDISDRVVVVISKPGMGKSTLLTYLAREIKLIDPCTWVVQVNLSEQTSYLHSIMDNEMNSQSAIDFLRTVAKIDVRNSNCLEQCIFNNCWQVTGRMALLLDGYDEVCPIYETLMIHIIKNLLHTCINKIWITSRILCKDSIERIVQSPSFSLDPFSKIDQRMFLKRVWGKVIHKTDNVVLDDFVDEVLRLIEFSLKDTEKPFTSVPLQTLFIAEMFEDNLRHFKNTKENNLPFRVDILTLYEGFFRKKCEIHLKEKRGYDITKKGVKDDFETFIRDAENIHELCALVTLLTPCDLDRLHDNTVLARVLQFIDCMQKDIDITGVIHYIKNGKPKFIHRTFAEYFVAKWFTKHYDQNIAFIKEILQRPNLYMVVGMMTRIQTRGFKLHMSVINRDKEAFRTLLEVENINLRDSGGRTALHLVAVLEQDDYFARLLLEYNANISLVDALQWTALRYADATQNWKAVGLFLQKGGKEADLVLTKQNLTNEKYTSSAIRTASEHGHETFLRLLLKNGVNVNMLLDEEHHTPLHIAAKSFGSPDNLVVDCEVASCPMSRSERILDQMLKFGADVNLINSNGQTVLHILSETGNIHVIKFIMERTTNETAEEMRSGTKRLCRVLNGFSDTLFQEKVLTQIRDSNGNTAEEIADQYGHVDVARYLRDTRFSIDGFLRDAASVGDPKLLCLVRFLVEDRGADIQWKDENGKTPLHYAAKNDNVDILKYLVEKGASLQSCDNNNDTPLHDAATIGHLKVVAWLIEHSDSGCNVLNNQDKTPLHNACAKGHLEIVEYLVKNSAFTDCCDISGDSPLHVAASCGQVSTVALLVEKCGVDLNSRDVDGRTALHRACHIDVAHYLAGRGARSDARDLAGNIPLHIAAQQGKLDMAKFFIEKCCNEPNAQDNIGLTPLHRACIGGHLCMAQYLVIMGAKTSVTDKNGDTPLHMSAFHGHLSLVRFLVGDCNRDPNLTRTDNMTPLHRACMGGHLQVVKYLITKGAKTFVRDEDGDTPLHVSAGCGKLNLVEFLIEECFNVPNKRNNVNRTPLHLACINGHMDTVEYLVKKSDDTYIRDNNGDTALHVASFCGQLHVVKFLIEKCGIASNINNYTNSTPMHRACVGGHLEVVKYLMRKGAKTCNRNNCGDTPLHLSASHGVLDVVKFLIINCKHNPNILDDIDRTPLHRACAEGHLNVVQYLLSEGAKIELSDKNSETPLHVAAYHGKLNVVKLLIDNCHDDASRGKCDGWSLMHSACMGGHKDMVQYLFMNGVRTNSNDEDGDTPLHIAAYRGNLDLVSFLVEVCDVDPNEEQIFTKTPLHRACIGGQLDVLRYLMRKGSNKYINARNEDGPLQVATLCGKLDVVIYLVENCGVDFNLRGYNNWTPLHSACFGGHLDIVQYLVKKGANVFLRDIFGDTPLHISTNCGKGDVVAFLIDVCGMNPEIKGSGSMTPLHSATMGGFLEVVMYLVDFHKVDVHCKDSRGRTPLDIAKEKGDSPSVLHYLLGRTTQHSTHASIAFKLLKLFRK